MKQLDEYLGRQVHCARHYRGISYKFFAEAMGMTVGECVALEQGRIPFTAETLLRVVIALGVDMRAIWRIRPLRDHRSANDANMRAAIRKEKCRKQPHRGWR